MPYGGGIFLPSETAYRDPGRFRDVLEAEGNKQARYLAEMDQFFAQLEESQRQFDITVEMKERFFEEQMAFEESKLEWQSGESELDRALRRWEVGETVGLEREKLKSEERRYESGLGIEREKLGMEREKLGMAEEQWDFYKDVFEEREGRQKEYEGMLSGEIFGGGETGIQPSTQTPYLTFFERGGFGESTAPISAEAKGPRTEPSYDIYGDWGTY